MGRLCRCTSAKRELADRRKRVRQISRGEKEEEVQHKWQAADKILEILLHRFRSYRNQCFLCGEICRTSWCGARLASDLDYKLGRKCLSTQCLLCNCDVLSSDYPDHLCERNLQLLGCREKSHGFWKIDEKKEQASFCVASHLVHCSARPWKYADCLLHVVLPQRRCFLWLRHICPCRWHPASREPVTQPLADHFSHTALASIHEEEGRGAQAPIQGINGCRQGKSRWARHWRCFWWK